jgi:hypothetical protein
VRVNIASAEFIIQLHRTLTPAQAPLRGGRSAKWMAAERASARAAQPPATEPMRDGGGPEEAGADDNQRIMTSDSFLPKKPIIMQLSADPFRIAFARRLEQSQTTEASSSQLASALSKTGAVYIRLRRRLVCMGP